MKLKRLTLFFLAVIFSVTAQGQELENRKPVQIPASIKREVVRKILVSKFSASKSLKIIYLSKDEIEESWLPVIPNIKFRLLTAAEIQSSGTKVYFFTEPERVQKTYSIGFAFGTPGCYYSGSNWSFRLTNNKLRIWEQTGGFGGGCAVGDKTPAANARQVS